MTSSLLIIITIINFLGLLYLTFLVYKKNKTKSKATDINTNDLGDTKISLTRFNPFDDVGGDQSFILCLLTSQIQVLLLLHYIIVT